jgi:hypothetical protein
VGNEERSRSRMEDRGKYQQKALDIILFQGGGDGRGYGMVWYGISVSKNIMYGIIF